MKKTVFSIVCAIALATCAFVYSNVAASSSDRALNENIEVLADDEGEYTVPYNEPVWERHYRNSCEYNCAKPGDETC